MKKIAVITIIIVFFFSLIFYKIFSSRTKTITINNHQIAVELADDDEKRTKGLSGREGLPDNQGMLFIFPKEGFYNFWMHKMKFSLDFVWIQGNIIVDLTENVSPPQNQNNPPLFTSKVPSDKVLELTSGTVNNKGIKIGDLVEKL